jgi:hypothetical protein
VVATGYTDDVNDFEEALYEVRNPTLGSYRPPLQDRIDGIGIVLPKASDYQQKGQLHLIAGFDKTI